MVCIVKKNIYKIFPQLVKKHLFYGRKKTRTFNEENFYENLKR